MKRLMMLAVLGVLVASGCSGESSTGASSQLTTLAEVQAVLAKGGLACIGTPKSYKKPKIDENITYVNADVDPIEILECKINGVVVGASRWKTQAQRVKTMSGVRKEFCSFTSDGIVLVEAGTWIIGANESTPKDLALTRRIGIVLGIKPTVQNCGAATIDTHGVMGKPIHLVGGGVMTISNPKVAGDTGPSVDVDIEFTNNGSTATPPPLPEVVCADATGPGGFLNRSTFDPNASVKPGATSRGTLKLMPSSALEPDSETPNCNAPAFIRLGEDGPTVPLSNDVVHAYNAAG